MTTACALYLNGDGSSGIDFCVGLSEPGLPSLPPTSTPHPLTLPARPFSKGGGQGESVKLGASKVIWFFGNSDEEISVGVREDLLT